ncbi:MAG: TonB-dependent receptor [Acidobacteriota bacterium]
MECVQKHHDDVGRTVKRVGRSAFAFVLTLILSLLFVDSPIMAQTFRGSIGGTVRDASGAVVPNAGVTLTETATKIESKTETNAEGNYLFPNLPLGNYLVLISRSGFKEAHSTVITLTTQQTVRFDAVLELGEVSQKVEVVASAPTINTENAQIDDVRPREDLLNLPLNSRGVTAFRYLTSSNYNGGWIGGQRGDFGTYTVDGVTAMAPAWGAWSGPSVNASLEALQEFKILSSNTKAEYTDLATIYVTTRQGTNDLHGSAFYITSNNALNARDFFASSKPKGPIQHEFGGSIGGPIKRNRTFFFGVYERTKNPGRFNATGTVPTLAMRTGDFSALLPNQVIMDPTTGQPFPGNIIPANRISPVSKNVQAYENFIPQPNFGPAGQITGNYRDLRPANRAAGRQTIRVDHLLRQGDSLSVRVNLTQEPRPEVFNGALPAFRWRQWRNTRNAYVSETHTFSPTLLNEFRMGFNRDASQLTGYHNGAEVVRAYGLQGINLSNKGHLTGVPNISFRNFSGLNESGTQGWAQETYEFLDNLTWVRGKHTFKGGILIRRNRINIPDSGGNDFGSMRFDGFATGYDYADFLLGIPHTTGRFERGPTRYNRSTESGFYFQDDFRVTPKLTLNLGLRYEYFTPPIDKYDMRYAFDPKTGNLVVPTQKVKDTQVSPLFPKSIPIVTAQEAGFPARSLLQGDRNNFAPRFGFAYQPFNNAKTVIRGGFGVYFTHLTFTTMDPFSGGPFHSNEGFLNTITNGVPLFQFPLPFTQFGDIGTQNVEGLVVNAQMPYTQQWSLTIERELGASIVAKIGYRGFQTNQLLHQSDRNRPMASTDPNNVNHYNYSNFYEVLIDQNGGIQKANGLDITVERKFTQGLTFQTGYTWMKNLTDTPGSSEVGFAWAGAQNPYDRRSDKGDTSGVLRHRFVGSALYELPFGTGKRYGSTMPGAVRQILGDWQVSTILNLESGEFLSPYFCCADPSNTRGFDGRPDRIGNPNISNPTNDRWFNPAAFVLPADNIGRFGNSAPGVIHGPGIINFDFGLFKYITIREGARLQLRMTATNFFNHPNFGNPDTDITSSNVGTILSTRGGALGGGARRIQVGLRFDF